MTCLRVLQLRHLHFLYLFTAEQFCLQPQLWETQALEVHCPAGILNQTYNVIYETTLK